MSTDLRPLHRFARTALTAAGVILAVILTGFVLSGSAGWTAGEMDLLRLVNTTHTAPVDAVALSIDWLFSPAVGAVLVLLAAGSVLLATRRPGPAIRFVAVVMIPTLGADVIKLLVHRARPDIPSLPHILLLEPGGLSFPSGHTSFAACLLLGIILVTSGRRWHPFVIGTSTVVVLATAASRVYLGVHYPSDVVASIVYSLAAVALVNAAWRLLLAHWSERGSGLPAEPVRGGVRHAR
ncbi:phosphatase PAP2 family protein [Cryobacterium sp. PH31-L1]|uniref:phosphatase PAP2 family protein n=1 Tax=Cryobacterium sp. PH31-L1 TaxID=3046199 RepID=UPI0024BA353C|nr:phosphatase PAP2 family protein [Cryobacterium sp. PH31-L1]MDJ0379136.1 phosphatase PAP2 family protein [Cryobacterium sp. PH31-L1]